MKKKSTAVQRRDLRYRGIMTYRGLRLIALIAMTVSALCGIALFCQRAAVILGSSLFDDTAQVWLGIGQAMGQITFPLLLVASFGIVLEGTESVRRMLLTYFVLALLTYAVTVLFLSNFLLAVTEAIPALAEDMPTFKAIFDEGLSAEDADYFSHIGINLFRRIMTQLIPGDGTVHIDYLNTVLAQFNTDFRVPDLDTLRGIVTGLHVPGFLFDLLVRAVASLDPDATYQALSRLLQAMLNAVSADIPTLLNDYVVPWLGTRLISRMNFNVFWDLFLYTAVYSFACGHPKKLKGGKLLLFRSCAAIPATWLLISAMVSARIRTSMVQVPVELVAALSTRSLSGLALFFMMVLFQKYREAELAVDDPTGASWKVFSRTNRSALQFSCFSWAALAIVSVADGLLGFIPALAEWGIGATPYMWTAGPFLMLYSYNRQPRHKWLNVAVPVYYVLHVVIVVLGMMLLTDRVFDIFMPVS